MANPPNENPFKPEYWAAFDTLRIGEQLVKRVEGYGTSQLTSGVNSRLARQFQYYLGFDPGGVHATSQVLRGGEQGELAEVRVNHSRPLVNTLLNLIVAPKVVWTPKAVNIDYDSIRECDLAAAILEYYWVERQVSKYAVRALEEALVFAEGFVLAEWDEDAGDDYAVDPGDEPAESIEDVFAAGSMSKTGDIVFTNVSTWDVVRDPTKPSWEALDWIIIRRWKNKYELMAKYPDQAQYIQSQSDDVLGRKQMTSALSVEETDDIPCYQFFHKRTPALPRGREVVFLSNRTVLVDRSLTYESVPLYRVSAGEMIGTPFGYTPFLDILGIQELMDSLHTSIASNQTTFGTQNIAMQTGTEENSIDDAAGGLRVWYYPQDGKPPEPLQLCRTPGEIFQYLDSLKKQQELIFGLNSVVRGEPQSGELSGSALALLQSQALQQSSVTQANYLRFVEGVGSCVLAIIKSNLSVPKKVAIVGKSSQFLVTDVEYTGESLERIHKVQVEVGNPLSQTPAGRAEMAKDLMNLGLVQTPDQYLEVLSTGRLEPMTQSLKTELLLIRSENEALAKGPRPPIPPVAPRPPMPPRLPDPNVPGDMGDPGDVGDPGDEGDPGDVEFPPVLALDDHALHAREHRSVLANPEARRNEAVVHAVLAHIDMHEQALLNTSPTTLMLVGQQPLPPPGMPPGPGGEGGAPAPGNTPPSGEPPMAPQNPAAGKTPKPPFQPKNPSTGQRWNAVDAGGAVPRAAP